jgi:hypothetical protein
VVYGRRVAGRTLRFGVSGKLWRNSLIMYDKETGSEWSQVTGEAIAGPLKGHRLEKLLASDRSSRVLDWLRTHPGAVVLRARGMSTPGGDTYRLYHSGDETGIRNLETLDDRLPDKLRVVGVEVAGAAYTVPPKLLPSGEVRRFRIPGGALALRRSATGVEVVEAPNPAEALVLYWFVWRDFHPGSPILGEADVLPEGP